MQYAYIFIAVITLFWDKISSLFASKESKIVILAVVFYYLYDKQKTKETNEKLLSDFSGKEDDAGIWAIDMWNALHPYLQFKVPTWVPILGGYFDDGTDEKAVERIGYECGKYKAIKKLVDAYKSLYGDDLKAELKAEGVLDIFEKAYNGTSTTKPGDVGTKTKGGSNGTKYIYSGKTYKVKGNYNLRNFDVVGEPSGKKTVENEEWNVLEIWTNRTLGKGSNLVKDTFCRARKKGDYFIKDYWIALGAFKP